MNEKVKNILEWVYCIVIALVIAFLIKGFIGTPTVVEQRSMTPTFEPGNRLILNKWCRTIKSEIKRGVTGIYGKGMYTNSDKLILMCAVRRNDIANINANSEYSEEQKNTLMSCLQKDYIDVKSTIENTKNITDIIEHLNNNSFHGNRFITKQELQEMFARNTRY